MEQHTRGGERFSWFVVSCHNFVGSLSCIQEGDAEVEVQWTTLTNQFECKGTSETRSALVFAIASASCTFLQKPVCIYELIRTTPTRVGGCLV